MNELSQESRGCPILADQSKKRAEKYLAESGQFRLGNLPTETPHPLTTGLSSLAKTNLSQAIKVFNQVDQMAVQSIAKVRDELDVLKKKIESTLQSGDRVFFCGCGATGRLSISLEALWREAAPVEWKDRVFSFIAGGDYALVKSIENFEDHPEYGVQQLKDLGFRKTDLLIAITEGGETPFVIGAAQFASEFSNRNPFFLFCNPPELLKKTTLRSKQILENKKVRPIFFETGPMALSGSTRLQATTVQQLAAGSCLFACLPSAPPWTVLVDEFMDLLKSTDFGQLSGLIEAEAEIYKNGGLLLHQTDRFGVTVLTDTTERTPTFSLMPFESSQDGDRTPSWTFLNISNVSDGQQAWKTVLGREPRALSWSDIEKKFGLQATYAFDFSHPSPQRQKIGFSTFSILDQGYLKLSLNHHSAQIPMPQNLLIQHLLVKVCLNIISTLVMARLGRIDGNVMVYVRPTNKKLIDRSIRYVQWLLERNGQPAISYEQICHTLFKEMESAREDSPIIPRVVSSLTSKPESRS